MADPGAAQSCALPEASLCLISGSPDREPGVFTAVLTPPAGVLRITGV